MVACPESCTDRYVNDGDQDGCDEYDTSSCTIDTNRNQDTDFWHEIQDVDVNGFTKMTIESDEAGNTISPAGTELSETDKVLACGIKVGSHDWNSVSGVGVTSMWVRWCNQHEWSRNQKEQRVWQAYAVTNYGGNGSGYVMNFGKGDCDNHSDCAGHLICREDGDVRAAV